MTKGDAGSVKGRVPAARAWIAVPSVRPIISDWPKEQQLSSDVINASHKTEAFVLTGHAILNNSGWAV